MSSPHQKRLHTIKQRLDLDPIQHLTPLVVRLPTLSHLAYMSLLVLSPLRQHRLTMSQVVRMVVGRTVQLTHGSPLSVLISHPKTKGYRMLVTK